MKQIIDKEQMSASFTIPGSKSVTHRALIAAGLAEGKSLLRNPLTSEDTTYTANAIKELGAGISMEKEETTVSGMSGIFSDEMKQKRIFLGNSGTSYRLLLSTVTLARGEYILTGNSRMEERPIGDLVRALNRMGAEASFIKKDGFPPVFIRAKGIRGGKVEVSGDQSSQYISSLLLASPYADRDVEIDIKGGLVSRPYVDLTLEVMEQFGVPVLHEGYKNFKIRSGQRYRACQFNIEGDVSSASYFWAAAAVTGGTITTENIHPFTTKQGDIAFLDIMEEMGCHIDRNGDRVTLQGRRLSGVEVDMGAMPDMVPTLAAIALFAEGKTVIRNVPHLRYKESDRLQAIALEWSRLGGRVEERPDGLTIHGGSPLSGTVVDPHNDHRIAMSLAVIGLNVPKIFINSRECVNKSFPQFWELWNDLKAGITDREEE